MRNIPERLRLRFLALAIALAMSAGMTFSATHAFAGESQHHVAIHVDSSDPKLINMALNNVQNVKNG